MLRNFLVSFERGIIVAWIGLYVSAAHAYEIEGMYANFKRVGFDLATTKVSNYQEYENSPYSEINRNTQGVLKGVFDFAFEYEKPKYRFDNMIYAEYGKSRIYGNPGKKKYTENADELRLTSEYIYKIWHFDNSADLGPLVNISYLTEFTSDMDVNRRKVVQSMQGLKMINGTEGLTDFHLLALEELDFTHANEDTKTAWQIGFTYKHPFAQKYRFELECYYRDYLSYSRYESTDFRYEFFTIAKLNVMMRDKFFLEPYISYFRAEDREHKKAASNLMFGVAAAFTEIVKLF